MISAHFDFDRIAERRETDQLHRCADEQAHLEQATAAGGGTLISVTLAALPTANEVKGWLGISRCFARRGGFRLNQNFVGQTGADANAHVADLANDGVFAADHFNFLLFAQAHFAQTLGQIIIACQLLDAHRGAVAQMAQRAQIGLRDKLSRRRPYALALRSRTRLR